MGRWRERDEEGQQVFEFVMILPFVLILVFLLVEATAALQTWSTIEHASREGARLAAVSQCKEDAKARTVQRSGGILSAGDVSMPVSCSGPGSDVAVQVDYTYVPDSGLTGLVNRFLGGSVINIPMSARTYMRVEE